MVLAVAACATPRPAGSSRPAAPGQGGAAAPVSPTVAPSGTGAATAGASGPGPAQAPAGLERYLVPSKSVRTRYRASYTPATTLVEGAARSAVTHVGGDAITFDAAKVKRHGLALEPGRVLLIAGKALRKIRGVTREGATVRVATTRATLADAIDDGEFSFDAKLPLDRPHTLALIDRAGNTHLAQPSPTVTGPVPKWTFKKGTVTYTIELKSLQAGRAVKIRVIAERKRPGEKSSLKFSAVGTFRNVWVKGKGRYESSKLKTFEYDQPGLEGDVELKMMAAGAGIGKLDFPFPGAMLRHVVMVGPIPVTVGIGIKMIGSVTVPGTASVQAVSRFKFQGDQGFKYDGTDVKAEGRFANLKLDPEPFDPAAGLGIPVDAQWGVAFPRVSLSFFGQGVVPYIHTGVVVGANLRWGPLCKSGYVKFTSQAGYDMQVLGVPLSQGKVTLKQKELRAPKGGCKK